MKPTVSFDPAELTINIEPVDGASRFTVWVRKKNVTHAHTVLESDMFPASPDKLTWIKLWDFTPKHRDRLVAGEYEACVIAIDEKLNILGDEASVVFSLSDEQCTRIASEYAKVHGGESTSVTQPASPSVSSEPPPSPVVLKEGTETPATTEVSPKTIVAPVIPGPPTRAQAAPTNTEAVPTPTLAAKVAPGKPTNFRIIDGTAIEWDPAIDAVRYYFSFERFLTRNLATSFELLPGLTNTTEDTRLDLEGSIEVKLLNGSASYRLSITAVNGDGVYGEKAMFEFHISEGILVAGERPAIREPMPKQPILPASATAPPAPAKDTQEVEELKRRNRELQYEMDTLQLQRATILREIEASKQETAQARATVTDSRETLKRSQEVLAQTQRELEEARNAQRSAQERLAEQERRHAETNQQRVSEQELRGARPANPNPPAQPAGGGRSTARGRFLTGMSKGAWFLIGIGVIICIIACVVFLRPEWLSTIANHDWSSGDAMNRQVDTTSQGNETGNKRIDERAEIARQQDEINRLKIEGMKAKSSTPTLPIVTSPVTHLSSANGSNTMTLTLPSTNSSGRVVQASINNNVGNVSGLAKVEVNNKIEINDNSTTYVHPDGWPKGWEPTLPVLVAGKELPCGIHEFVLAPRDVQRICILPGWYVEPAMEDMVHMDVKRGTETTQQDHLIGKTNEVVHTQEFRLRPKAHETTVTVRVLVRPLSGCICPGGHH